MSANPLVTIAICTFNRAETLRLTLNHMRQLQIPPNLTWEVLVIDNNSTDNTPAVLKELALDLPLRGLHEPRPGQSFARNLILKEARGKFILWTDDDALVDPEWLNRIVSTFDETGADFVFGRVEPAWPGDKVPSWYSSRVNGLFAIIDYGSKSFIASDPHKSFVGVNFAGRAEAHQRLGEFRVDFGVRGNQTGGGLGEDTEMYERALARGMKMVYQPGVVVRHMIPAVRATKMFNWKKALLNQRRFYDYLVKNPPDVPWFLGLPRYYYRAMLDDLGLVMRGFVTGDKPLRFFHELYLLRFAGLFWQSCQYGLRRPRKP